MKKARQTLVVGDIQGCYQGLMALLDKANFDPSLDTLCAVGDLIARGEDSLATIEYLMRLKDSFVGVLGNHDLHFLSVSQGLKKAKRSDNLDALLTSPNLNEIINWLRQLPLAHQLSDKHVMVHAGLYPKWSIAKLIKLSNEVSKMLKSDRWQNFLPNMYGSLPKVWDEKLEGDERLRFIINACTRMRFLDNKDTLEFNTKCAPDDAPTHLTPWFLVNNPNISSREMVLFGHWAALLGQTSSTQFIGLDTGYVWGQQLTCVRLEDNKRYIVSAQP